MKQKIISPDRSELKNLIESIGGEAGLYRILGMFYLRMKEDPMIGYFFEEKAINEISRKQGDFILLAAGLRSRFDGRGPATAHTALPPIYEGHFDRRLVLLRETLIQEGLSSQQVETWVKFEESFRALVVSKG